MQLNAFIITINLDFEVTNSYKVKWEKSHFDSNVGISCREVTRSRMKPSCNFCLQFWPPRSVCGKGILGNWQLESLPSWWVPLIQCLSLLWLREALTAQSTMSKYSMASKFSFAGTLNLRVCPLGFAEKIPEEWTQSVIIGIPNKAT